MFPIIFSWPPLYFSLTLLQPLIAVLYYSVQPADQFTFPVFVQTILKVGKFHCNFIHLIAFSITPKNKAALIQGLLSVLLCFFLPNHTTTPPLLCTTGSLLNMEKWRISEWCLFHLTSLPPLPHLSWLRHWVLI